MKDKQYPQYSQHSQTPQSRSSGPSKISNFSLTRNGICKRFIHGKCKLADTCQYSHDRKQVKPCVSFLNTGQCSYGMKCNYMHDLKTCQYFLKGKCEKGEFCQLRHTFKSCPNYDMGFCIYGDNCKYKHIVRKLCWNYVMGFCQKGNLCPNHHPRSFVDQDFQGSKQLFLKLGKQVNYHVCNFCHIIGHKANKCSKKIQLQGNQRLKCGICGQFHTILQDCNDIKTF